MSVVASSSARLRGKFRNRPEWAAEAKGLCAFTAATVYTAYFIPTLRKSWLEGNAAIALLNGNRKRINRVGYVIYYR